MISLTGVMSYFTVTSVFKTNYVDAGENKFTSQVMTSSERPPPPPFTLAGATRGARRSSLVLEPV